MNLGIFDLGNPIFVMKDAIFQESPIRRTNRYFFRRNQLCFVGLKRIFCHMPFELALLEDRGSFSLLLQKRLMEPVGHTIKFDIRIMGVLKLAGSLVSYEGLHVQMTTHKN